MELRPTRECERRVEKFADLADDARAKGLAEAADRFLLLAWAAYDGQDGALQQDEPHEAEIRPLPQR